MTVSAPFQKEIVEQSGDATTTKSCQKRATSIPVEFVVQAVKMSRVSWRRERLSSG
jgi:hypothetical protein